MSPIHSGKAGRVAGVSKSCNSAARRRVRPSTTWPLAYSTAAVHHAQQGRHPHLYSCVSQDPTTPYTITDIERPGHQRRILIIVQSNGLGECVCQCILIALLLLLLSLLFIDRVIGANLPAGPVTEAVEPYPRSKSWKMIPQSKTYWCTSGRIRLLDCRSRRHTRLVGRTRSSWSSWDHFGWSVGRCWREPRLGEPRWGAWMTWWNENLRRGIRAWDQCKARREGNICRYIVKKIATRAILIRKRRNWRWLARRNE